MNLVTLSGKRNSMGEAPKFSIFSLSGSQMMKLDPRTLTDRDAGIYMLYWINKTYPGVTYQDIIEATKNPQAMKGLFSSVGKFVGSGIKKVGNLAVKTVSLPVNAATNITQWAIKKGTKAVINELTPKQTIAKAEQGILSPQEQTMLAQLGQHTKSSFNTQVLGMNPIVLFGGGALIVGGLVFLLTRSGRRR